MTSRPETLEHHEPDSGCGVLLGLRDARVRVEVAEPDKLQLAVTWAAMHSTDTLIGPAASWEQELPVAGEGAPSVAEFCVPELAAVLGLSTDAGRAYLG